MASVLNKDQKQAINKIFKTYNDNNIKYVILRRHERLPETIPGRNSKKLDLDLLISSEDFNTAVKLANMNGFNKQTASTTIRTLVQESLQNPTDAVAELTGNFTESMNRLADVMKEPMASSKTYYEIACESNYSYKLTSHNLILDIKNHLNHVSPMHGNRWRLAPTVEQQMLIHREKRNDFYKPSPPDELAHIISHCIFEYKGKFTEYYSQRCDYLIEKMDSDDWERFEKILADIYFEASEIVLTGVNSRNYDDIRPRLRRYSDY